MKSICCLFNKVAIFCLVSLLLVSCHTPEIETEGIVFKNFKIISLNDDNILENHVLIIRSDSILDILSDEEFHRHYHFPDSLIVDGAGKYILPSFHEMHAHLQPGNPNHKNYLKHYLAYGITDMRVMAGSDELLSWKDSIQKGMLLGPELKVAGPLIDGNQPLWGTSHNGPVVSDRTKVDSIVYDHKLKGYDLIKLYERLSKEVYFEFLKAAQKHQIKVAGHIPFSLLNEPEMSELFNERSPSFEHFKNFGPLVTKEEINKIEQPKDLGYYGYELAANPDPVKIRRVVEAIKASNTWICPTAVLWRNSSDRQRIAGIVEGAPFQRLDNGLKNWWISTKENTQRNKDVNQLTALFLREMARQKVKLMVGTDFPNPFLIPGYSVHQEIHTLVAMGYSNLEALKAATIYPAEYWGQIDKKGPLKIGRTANLIILRENPLDDIKNTLSIDEVIYKGQHYQSRVLLD